VPHMAPSASDRPVLGQSEVTSRVTLLAELQAALAALGIQSVLVRKRRLVLRSAGTGLEPSGPTNPQLHVFAPGGTEIATTDAARYEFTTGSAFPAADPQAAAAGLRDRLHVQAQEQRR